MAELYNLVKQREGTEEFDNGPHAIVVIDASQLFVAVILGSRDAGPLPHKPLELRTVVVRLTYLGCRTTYLRGNQVSYKYGIDPPSVEECLDIDEAFDGAFDEAFDEAGESVE